MEYACIHIRQSTHCLWHVHRSQSRVERVVTGLDISISVRAFGYNKSSSDKDQIQRVVMRVLGTKHCECVGVWRHSIRYHDYVVILFRFQYWMCCVTALNESRLFRWIRDVEILIKIALFGWEQRQKMTSVNSVYIKCLSGKLTSLSVFVAFTTTHVPCIS